VRTWRCASRSATRRGGRRAALGVSVLDEALRGLAEIDPGAEVAAFALGGLATGPAARALWGEGDDARCEAAAALLLAGRSLEGKVARFSSRRDR